MLSKLLMDGREYKSAGLAFIAQPNLDLRLSVLEANICFCSLTGVAAFAKSRDNFLLFSATL